jgi:transposase
MPKKNRVTLSDAERQELTELIRSGKSSSRKLTRARVLLKSDENVDDWTDVRIAEALDVCVRVVEDVRKRFVEGGVKAAIDRRPQPARPEKHKIDGPAEAKLTMLACSVAPEGYGRWTLNLLADRMIELKFVDTVSHETVRKALKKANSSHG